MSHDPEPPTAAPAPEDFDLQALRDADRVEEIKEVLKVIANNMAMPLYLMFWISDILYVPQMKWEFLFVRMLIIPHCLTVQYLAKRVATFRGAQLVALYFNFGMAIAINYMIFRIDEPATPYYAGLNLIALGNLAFIPWTRRFYIAVALSIFAPYYIVGLLQSKTAEDFTGLFLNSFFVFSTIIMLFFIRFFNERLRQRELSSRIALHNEVRNRDRIIIEKSEEAIRLSALSRQFSPQVVSAIRNRKIDLSSVRRSKICAIFIDIVNSTERVARGDKDKIHKAIAMFMDDTVRTLLKYDITVDKFLGDGILAFSNDPVAYPDYVDRVLRAAIEIRNRIKQNQDQYELYWMNHLEVRIGVAVGYANVGFYGNDRYYKSYTAIGAVINLASRLCSSAEPNQILVTSDVVDAVKASEYVLNSKGHRSLKGFESDMIRVYSVDPAFDDSSAVESTDCPVCSTGMLFLDTDEKGIFVLKCRECGHIKQGTLQHPRAAGAA